MTEVQRLSDRGLTAQEWCARPPERIKIEIDKARVQCREGPEYVASIAELRTSSVPHSFVLAFRAAKGGQLRRLRFEGVEGIGAKVRGSPCYPMTSVVHQRFPEYDILRRKIVDGRPCSRVTGLTP